PNIFPDRLAFKPKRWMGAESLGLDKYLVVFSRGPKSCLGMNCVSSVLPHSGSRAWI
ncbi:hypothetical protein BDZ89DRAFT_954805, partial [Hymenopellis radicata]